MKVAAECPAHLREVADDPWEAHVRLLASEAVAFAFAAVHELSPDELAGLHETALRAIHQALADVTLGKGEVFGIVVQAVVDRLTGEPSFEVVR